MLTPPKSFRELTTPIPAGPCRYDLEVPSGWLQGRGTFGGFVLAALTRAAESHLADPSWPLRSINGELCGPTVPGPAVLLTETLRAGGLVAVVAARLVQEGEVRAHLVATFARPRGAAAPWHAATPIEHPDWADTAAMPVDAAGAPEFVKHFELRNTGPWPFSREEDPIAHGWVRPRHEAGDVDAGFVVGCADGWWPALFTVLEDPKPIATVTFTLDLTSSLDGLDGESPLFSVGRVVSRREGYAVEARELWAPDGRLVALSQQTYVIIR